ncbi:MAG: flavodoxin family protein [Spirochaetes bacterium]|uniref:Flavodoxin family protein n=1 Tax=Candidatus Ornithospirochaeta stercoripullorum TaxID=2840899 RepID=A0A9D9H2E5_9SPIO|nr:flavodoxin family protein [Candidatus Ornithospirochaeta stercoripullorum]
MRISILYMSVTGHTEEMSHEIAEGIIEAGCECYLCNIFKSELDKEAVSSSCGVIFGSPVYLATLPWQMQQFFETGCKDFDLAGKLGGAFATAHYAQGGADTAIMSMLGILLVKGMLVYSGGSALGLPFIHHGPVALDKEGAHFDTSREMFRAFGRRFAAKCQELFGEKHR